MFIGGDEVHTTCWEDNEKIQSWAAANRLIISDGTEATGGEGSVFGWYIDQIVDTVFGELKKRPVLWSPLNWNAEHPPAKLVSSRAVLNLWTGDIKTLAYNITKSGTNDVVTSVGWCDIFDQIFHQCN